jgi:hypothetical protein
VAGETNGFSAEEGEGSMWTRMTGALQLKKQRSAALECMGVRIDGVYNPLGLRLSKLYSSSTVYWILRRRVPVQTVE